MHRPFHVGFAPIDRHRVVCLDTRRDRYRLLPPGLSERLIAGQAVEDGAPGLGPLLDLDLLAPGAGAPIWPAFVAASQSVLDTAGDRRSPSLPSVAWRLALARHRLRTSGLDATFDRLRRRRGETDAHGAPDAAAALSRGFRQVRRRLPLRNICLLDSLVLSEWLLRQAVASTLVLGVRLDPFAAHCWVQAGDRLLSDPLARIAEFTPIYAV